MFTCFCQLVDALTAKTDFHQSSQLLRLRFLLVLSSASYNHLPPPVYPASHFLPLFFIHPTPTHHLCTTSPNTECPCRLLLPSVSAYLPACLCAHYTCTCTCTILDTYAPTYEPGHPSTYLTVVTTTYHLLQLQDLLLFLQTDDNIL